MNIYVFYFGNNIYEYFFGHYYCKYLNKILKIKVN